MKKSICILLVLLLLCACAPQATSSTEPSSVTSSGQLHGIMSVPLLSMISVDYSISVPNETPSSEPEPGVSWPKIYIYDENAPGIPNIDEAKAEDYEKPYKNFPLQYTEPYESDLNSLVMLANDSIRQRNAPLTEEEVKQLLRVTLPLGMRLIHDLCSSTLPDATGDDAKVNKDYDEYDWYSKLADNPYGSIESMKNYLSIVFSKGCFTNRGIGQGGLDAIVSGNYAEIDGELYGKGDEFGFTGYNEEWQIDTARILSQSENEIVVEIDRVQCYYDFDYSRYELRLIKEDGIWKFDHIFSGIAAYIKHQNLWSIDFEEWR